MKVLFPLQFTNMINKVDVVAETMFGGDVGRAAAVRYGISLGLRSFVDDDTIECMRIGK